MMGNEGKWVSDGREGKGKRWGDGYIKRSR